MKAALAVIVIGINIWLVGWNPDWLMLGIWAVIGAIVIAISFAEEAKRREKLRR